MSTRSTSLVVGTALATAAVISVAMTMLQRRRRESKKKHNENKSNPISFFSADKSVQLHGDLYLGAASKKMAAIVIVAGSGPIDRDGNVPGLITGLRLDTSKRFAQHMMMGDGNIAVLTYDKRGVGKSVSKKDKNLYYRTGMMDLVSDAVEAVRFLQNHPQVDPTRIAVMGHSEGAIIMPLICQEVEKGVETPSKDELPLVAPVKGAIFLAGFGCNLFDAMKMQRETALQEVQEQTGLKGWSMRKSLTRERMEKQYSDLMTKIEAPGNEDYVSMYLGLAKIPAKWFREHKAYDASSATKKITCHCLAITGQADVQVPHDWCDPITAKKLVPHAASIESHQPLRLTHALRSSDGPSRILSVKEDYTRLGKLPLDPELLSLIDNWCARVLCS